MKTQYVLLLIVLSISLIDVTQTEAVAEPNTLVVPDEYPTITSALANATEGDTIFLKKGTHDGPLNQTLIINKTISLIGEDSVDTILNLHPNYTQWSIFPTVYRSNPDAIRIEADNVKLSNLKLSYIGEIRAISDKVEIVNNNVNSHHTGRGIIITGSNCSITGNQIIGRIKLEGSSHTIRQNNFSFLRLESANSSIITSNILRCLTLISSHNNVLSANMVNTKNLAYAIDLSDSNNNIFHDNKITVTVWNINLKLTKSQNNRFYNNAFIDEDDDSHVEFDNNSSNNFWNNSTIGNYWSNYHGTDNNGDGIGDMPYIISGNNTDRYPLMTPVDVEAIPEFSSWILLLIFFIVSFAVIACKKKLQKVN